MDYSRASFDSPYGTINEGWESTEGKIMLKVTIPANTSSTILIPISDPSVILENGKPVINDFESDTGVRNNIIFADRDVVRLQRGSGEYIYEFTEQ